MPNNEIISGIDDIKCDGLTMNLKKLNSQTLLVSPRGSIDSYTNYCFSKKNALIIEAGYKNIIFNLISVPYISSVGIGSFISVLKILSEKKGKLFITHISPRVFEVFQLLGFASFISFEETVQDAINKMKVPEKKEVFPLVFKCPLCSKKFRVSKNGRYRCTECSTIISIDKSGIAIMS